MNLMAADTCILAEHTLQHKLCVLPRFLLDIALKISFALIILVYTL